MYSNIKEIISVTKNPYFSVSYDNGEYCCGNKESYYSKKFPAEFFSYDVSNNKVLANIDEFGVLKQITFYRSCYVNDDIPGVWIAKDFSTSGSFYYKIKLQDEEIDLSKCKLRTESDLVDNLFPRIHVYHKRFNATILAYSPISNDGKNRLRALVYGIYLQNTATEPLVGSVMPPNFSPEKNYFTIPNASGQVVECILEDKEVRFCLKPGQSIWIPTVIYAPGENETVKLIEEKGTLYWFNQTKEYFKSVLGQLTMKQDPLTAAIFERAVYQGMGAVAMNRNGEVSGSNWGTYPPTTQIWMKDMYYSYLPLSILEPEFFKKGFLWFLENGIRPKGSKYEGGILHSLSNSVTSVIMAGLYYDYTADSEFFKNNVYVYEKLKKILEQVLELQENSNVWLFPSIWISDAFSLGKYHTGSNICVWKAFKGIGRIAGEVFKDTELQNTYNDIADKIKSDIEKYMVIDGKFGKQYLEGIGGLTEESKKVLPLKVYEKECIDQAITFLSDVIEGDNVNLVMHDGEESDTTLIPFYGYKQYDDTVLRNYLKFTMSEENPTYGVECRGIKWGNESGATFPGYSTGFAGIVDAETMNGERGYMRELKRLCDLDGSWWWWPYKCGAKTGDVVRNNSCGKCGWASGVFASMLITQVLGIQYDAPSKTLNFRPFSPCSDFNWKNAPVGNSHFDFEYNKKGNETLVSVTNRGNYPITANIEILGNGIPYSEETDKVLEFTKGYFLDHDTIKVKTLLQPDKKYQIIVKQ